jgi:type IX secretion system PorP/SprF family membrane protein
LQSIDHSDQLLPENSSSAVMPVFSFGTYYYSKKYYVGISLPSFLSYSENSDGYFKPENDMAAYSYLVNGGFDVDLNSDMTLRPSVLIGFNAMYSTWFYLNSMLGFKEKVWVGAGYRSYNTFMGIFQCQLNYQLRLAYAYNFVSGELGKYLNGSHEIGLNYNFRYSRRVSGPRSF